MGMFSTVRTVGLLELGLYRFPFSHLGKRPSAPPYSRTEMNLLIYVGLVTRARGGGLRLRISRRLV